MKVPKFKVYLDMDGVIADWAKQFERFSGGIPVEQYEADKGKEARYQLVNDKGSEYYATLPWMTDGELLYNFLNCCNTEILSHAPNSAATKGKLIWLKNNNIKLKPNLVSKSTDKAKFATPDSILIDDKPQNVDEFVKAGGKAILHKNSIDTINKLKELTGIKESNRIYNSILNPQLFDENDNLKQDVLKSLKEIGKAFYENTELEAPIKDILMIGSSAGYNWTPTSDIDLHILIDFKDIDENKDLVKGYVDALKSNWNQNHHIRVGNHPVEVYIQDIDEKNKSQAVYSILNDKWVLKPEYEDLDIDKDAIKKKYKDLTARIDKAVESEDIDALKKLMKKIYDMRQTGLDSVGEYSTENLVFKLLRTKGYINKIKDTSKNLIDKKLSID
jgi:predicted nucleotidyltransferase